MDNNEKLGKVLANEADLEKVSGGSGYKPIHVDDGENNSALCPYCPDTALDYRDTGTMNGNGGWEFQCPRCGKKFFKYYSGEWYVESGSIPPRPKVIT